MKNTWLLALETSVTRATLALACDGTVVAEQSFTSERSQECDLFPPLRDLLGALPTGETLATVIVGTGPGSYNGARVGIAAAQAVAQTHRCPVAGLCSFEGIEEWLGAPSVWAVGDARRGSFFILPLIEGRAQSPPQLLGEEQFRKTLAGFDGPRVTFESPQRLPTDTAATLSRSTARGLLQSWLRRSPEERDRICATTPEAFYLRPPHITKSRKSQGL